LIIAFVIFLMVRSFNRMQKAEEVEEEAAPPEPSAEEQLLTEIRDLLKQQA
jgi:large conductance mechanosensitive channel